MPTVPVVASTRRWAERPERLAAPMERALGSAALVPISSMRRPAVYGVNVTLPPGAEIPPATDAVPALPIPSATKVSDPVLAETRPTPSVGELVTRVKSPPVWLKLPIEPTALPRAVRVVVAVLVPSNSGVINREPAACARPAAVSVTAPVVVDTVPVSVRGDPASLSCRPR